MVEADLYIAVATIAPLFVLTVGLSTEGFKQLFFILLAFTSNSKVKAGVITLAIGTLTLTFGTLCEVVSLVALFANGASEYWRNTLPGLAIGLVVTSVAALLPILLYAMIVGGDEASEKCVELERARLDRMALRDVAVDRTGPPSDPG